jgi:putative CocE/NonD family hydrolase
MRKGSSKLSENETLYDVLMHEENAMIPMRDGVRLAADIYRPAINGAPVEKKFPVILQRTPYNKKAERFVEQGKYFVKHGYTVVIQDCRGRYKSEGVFTKYINEPEDGYDTIEWLAKLPYTSGKIGMWGLSYGAHVQACAAMLNPPHLKTIVVNMGGMYNGWDHGIRNHGAFALKQLTWAFRQVAEETDNPVVKEMLKIENVMDWFRVLPLRKGLNPLSIAPNFEKYMFEMMTHGDYDDYWKHMGVNWSEYYEQTSDIPMVHISGWYDNYCGTASPIRLLLGHWIHGGIAQTYAGDVDFGSDAAITDFTSNWHVRWFDHFLKEKGNGVGAEPAIKLFIMGTGDGHKDENGRLFHGGYWRTEADWPLPGTQFTNYYFHGDGALSLEMPDPNELPTTYTYDPRHPVPTIGGSMAASEPLYVGGAFDQREREFKGDPRKGFYGSRPPYLPLKARHDVVVFQTGPLKEDIEVTGPITVKLHASSSAPDTDFTAKLIDVYPPSKDFPSGFEMNLTDGIIRARYRNSPEKQELMKPGEIYLFTIEPFGTANVFKKRHRIRIDISSSNFPRFDVNPNTGEPLGLNRRSVEADNTIYHDERHPSHVILPIIPSRK